MPATNAAKKMDYKQVKFDVEDMPPDAPEGAWQGTVPRGKCKIQPTKEDKFPMIILPVRLESTEEEGDEFEKALGTELSTFLVFGGKTSRGERMSKLRIREVCEAFDVDLDVLPKNITDPENDFADFIRAIEGKKAPVWTKIRDRSDTGEKVTELVFRNPKAPLGKKTDDDEDEDQDEKPAKKGGKAAANKSRR